LARSLASSRDTLTDAAGQLRIQNLLPGSWRLRVWAKNGSGQSTDVEVPAAGTVAVEIVLP
jgi:hypothetical protein